MSAFGRLWRRAPAWRLTLAAAVAFTALAVMFPPPHLHWLSGRGGATGTGDDAMPAGPRFASQPEPPPSDYGVVAFPPLGAGRSGIIPFSGRQVPLPAGTWQELALARSGGAAPEPGVLLGRFAADRVTGLLLAAGSGPVGSGEAPVPSIAACIVPDAIAHRIIPVPSSEGPLARECWVLTTFDRNDPASSVRVDSLLRGGFDRLAQMNVTLPRRMLALRYLRTSGDGWMTALLLLPDRTADRRFQAWVNRYAGALQKGFAGTLTKADLTESVVRDPD